MVTKRIVVELLNHEKYDALQHELSVVKSELNSLRKRFRDLESKYGYEVHLNSELCDLCRRSGVNFRPLLDHRNR